MAGCLYELPAPLLFLNAFQLLNAMASTANAIRALVDSNLSNAQLGAAVRAMYAPAKTAATKPELLSVEQFREKFPSGDVLSGVVGKFFNIKGRALPDGLQSYYPIERKSHQNIRVVPTEGGVPPGGDEVHIAPATPDGASLDRAAPGAPKKQSPTKPRTSKGKWDCDFE